MRRLALAATCGLLLASPAQAQTPIGTIFSYQGRLMEGLTPADGAYDFRFILFDAPAGGNQVGPIVTTDDTLVSTGLFTIGLNFGAVFTGQRRFLEVAVRPGASTGAYDTVSGRQELSATPFALFGASAPWTGVTGKPAGFADDVDNDMLAAMACSNGQVAKSTGSGWACGADLNTTYIQGPGVQINGNVISLAALGVGSANIQDGAVTQPKLADNAVTTAKLADASVNGSKLTSNSVLLAHMTDNSVGTAELVNAAVTGPKIAAAAVGPTHIMADAITTVHIAPGSISGSDIGTGQITSTQIGAAAVNSSEIAFDAIGPLHIQVNGVSATNIQTDAVTRSEISGTEVAIYVVASGCGNGGAFTTANIACPTVPCGGGLFNSCGGSCNQTAPQVCSPTLIGYLLSPAIPALSDEERRSERHARP